ncbi:hypothetical protein BD310DRAFT_980518 [Dichomitus squalens]|uniref:Uncharacterized protein n=1 Tax=Dichomitus squalens TaxID=114155 RepID=A0A4V6MWN7_9APHY|nr:hypothetical protein BD310DRAFT_980518 [Dichomitus squalens]
MDAALNEVGATTGGRAAHGAGQEAEARVGAARADVQRGREYRVMERMQHPALCTLTAAVALLLLRSPCILFLTSHSPCPPILSILSPQSPSLNDPNKTVITSCSYSIPLPSTASATLPSSSHNHVHLSLAAHPTLYHDHSAVAPHSFYPLYRFPDRLRHSFEHFSRRIAIAEPPIGLVATTCAAFIPRLEHLAVKASVTPLFFRLREHHCVSPAVPLLHTEVRDNDPLDEGAVNTYFPRGFPYAYLGLPSSFALRLRQRGTTQEYVYKMYM